MKDFLNTSLMVIIVGMFFMSAGIFIYRQPTLICKRIAKEIHCHMVLVRR